MAEVIHIDDLANPELTDTQKSILEFGESLDVDLSASSILDEAKTTLNLGDFGPMDFVERLELLCNEWAADRGITSISRFSLRNKLLMFAKNRLLIQDLLNRYPKIHEVEIQEPIIVAGLPRSGTTHLLNLMAADSRLRALPLWESYEPVPTPGESQFEDGTDPRYKRCDDMWNAMLGTTPLMAAMHPMNPDHIHEELELMGPDFASYNFEWLCHSPGWRDHYYATDQSPHYEYMKTVLKILTWQDGDTDGSQTRWVLKCPQHLEQLPVLQNTFPDSTIAITHRDPVSVIQSAVTMLAYGQRMSRKRVETDSLISYWSDRVLHLLEACTRDRHILDDEKSIDVLFHEFMADDLAMVEKIYRKAGLKMTDIARNELTEFINNHPRGKYGQVIYDLQADFGVEPEALRRRFDFYFERFPVRAET